MTPASSLIRSVRTSTSPVLVDSSASVIPLIVATASSDAWRCGVFGALSAGETGREQAVDTIAQRIAIAKERGLIITDIHIIKIVTRARSGMQENSVA